VPLLFASGIAACVTFLAWKSWRVLRDANASFHGARLRFRGRLSRAGAAWIGVTAVALAGTLWAGALNASVWAARMLDARISIPAEVVFSEHGMEPDAAGRQAAERALALYGVAAAWPEGWSPFPVAWRRTDMERAYLLAALRRGGESEAMLRRSWERDGADEGVAIVLGRLVRMVPSRRDEAIRWYDDVLSAHPAWRELREEQVTWLDLEGEHARMLASARAGAAAMPDDLESLRRLSLALIERGTGDEDVREGVALVRRTLEMAPGNAFAHVALARGLVKLGDADGAIAEFRRAMELDPQSPVIRSMVDEAAVQLGRPVAP
jgi:tetratricopeptide (TPR) repeat protein